MPGCSILINLQSSTLKKNIVPLCFISIIPMSLWPLLSMLRSTSLLFFPSHLSQLTSFNSSSIHLLQPLEFGVFSPLAKAYKRRIQEHSVYSAENISKIKFWNSFINQEEGHLHIIYYQCLGGCRTCSLYPSSFSYKAPAKYSFFYIYNKQG